MKTFMLAVALLAAFPVTAQEEATTADSTEEVSTDPGEGGPPKHVIGIAPLNLLVFSLVQILSLNMEYEQAISPTFAFHIAPSITAGTGNLFGVTLSGLGFGLGVGARFFLVGTAPEGLFVGPTLDFGYFRAGASGGGTSSNAGAVSFGGTGMIGYTFMLGAQKNINLSLGAGVRYGSAAVTSSGTTGTAGVLMTPALRFNLGYGF